MAARPTKIGARDPKTGKWWTLWTDNVYRLVENEDTATAPAPTEWIEPAPTPGAFRIGTGWVSPWNGDRPR